ncbi:PAS domain-containing protein (plasmid) [Azospirillum sp. A26]|uniref:PAS domain-containing protein n=1 Tax=Azospirillum sp. A26 TaxID=3160607 RepID=UPI0036701E97
MTADGERVSKVWPVGGGVMGELIRTFNWSCTPLGPTDGWPAALRVVVDLVLSSPMAMAVLWSPDLLVIGNDTCREIAAARHPGCLGRPLCEVWPDAWRSNSAVLGAVLRGEARSILDQRLTVQRHGLLEEAWFDLTYTPVRDETGSVAGILAIAAEVTERHRVEAENRRAAQDLQRKRELLETTFAQSFGSVALIRGSDLAVLLANSAYRTMSLGSGPAGLPAHEVWPDAIPQFKEICRRMLETGEPYVSDDERITLQHDEAGQGPAWFNWRLSRVILPRGEGWGLLLTSWETTQRRRAESALRESEARLRALVEATSYAVYRASPDWAEVFLLSGGGFLAAPQELSRTWLDDNIHPDDRSLVEKAVREAIDTRSVFALEHRARRSDGTFGWTLSRAVPLLDANGEIIEWFGAASDVTESRLAKENIQNAKHDAERAREAAEQAARSKSRFLAAASHDLRQPLQALFLFLEVVKPHISAEGQGTFGHLSAGLNTLRELLDSLLNISRLDAQIVRPAIEDFAIGEVIEPIANAYAPVAAAKGLELRVFHGNEMVRSDRTLLGQMVRNLIENALRYTEQGYVSITCAKAVGALRIDVGDSGIGIPAEHLDLIWEEFHQVGNPERDRSQGLGLGLAIVNRLSELLNHAVEVRSTPGAGSVFSIEIPFGCDALPPVANPVANPVAAVAEGGGLAVLVDDDTIVLLGLTAIFEHWGYEVLAADSLDLVLDMLKADGRVPDVILADYRLRAGQVGIEVIFNIRDIYGSDIPGLLLTGETDDEVSGRAAAHGLVIVHKPATSQGLRTALQTIAQQK